jgi:hypothetical protein
MKRLRLRQFREPKLAVSGQTPPAGPWLRGLSPLEPKALGYDKPLCASLDGFTLHAATKANSFDDVGREALLRYVLRPPLAQERLEQKSDGLVRRTLKKAYSDGTIAVWMAPLSPLCRLAMSVPPPRLHTVKYSSVLASASPWRSWIGPRPEKKMETARAAITARAATTARGTPEHATNEAPYLAASGASDLRRHPRVEVLATEAPLAAYLEARQLGVLDHRIDRLLGYLEEHGDLGDGQNLVGHAIGSFGKVW